MFKKQIRPILILILVIALVAPNFATTAHASYENTYVNTGNMRDDIIGVALTQVGYEEGENNYTKYGVWYDMPNAPWCGIFVSWCAEQAGIPTSILQKTGVANPSNFGLTYESGSTYTPKKGDLFFKQGFTHVGLVYYTEGEYFYTVEGNTSTTTYDGTSVMIRKRLISDFYFSSPNYSGSSNSSCSHNYETKTEADHPHKEYKVCTKCQSKTYTGNQSTSGNCNTCVQNNCSHTYGQWTKAGETQHSRTCSKCQQKESKSHNWNEGNVIKEATCLDEGVLEQVCSECGANGTKTIPTIEAHIFTDLSYLNEVEHQKVCTSCNEQITSKHTLNNELAFDNFYHWTSCSDCNGRINRQEHRFINGCAEPCADCGYLGNSNHNLAEEVIYDDTHHWQYCTGCDLKSSIAQHTYSSPCDEYCNGCDYKRNVNAKHQDVCMGDQSGHWSECSACKRTTTVESHVPGHNTADWEALVCACCQYELRSAKAHTHTYSHVESDTHNHWGTCACGESMEPEVHSWNIQTGRCTICDAQNQTTPSTNAPFRFLTKIWNLIWNK